MKRRRIRVYAKSDVDALKAYIKENPDKTVKEISRATQYPIAFINKHII